MNEQNEQWPQLSLAQWQDTYETLHLWSQIVGKIRLAQMPWINHSWHVPLYVTARGLTTSPIPYGSGAFEIDFDFADHRLHMAALLDFLQSTYEAAADLAAWDRNELERKVDPRMGDS